MLSSESSGEFSLTKKDAVFKNIFLNITESINT